MRGLNLTLLATAALWMGSAATAQAQWGGGTNFQYVEWNPPTTWTFADVYYDYVLEVQDHSGQWQVYEIYDTLALAEYWEMAIARRYRNTRIYSIWNPGLFIPISP